MQSWKVSGLSHPNGPITNLLITDTKGFANLAQGPAPWNATLDTGAGAASSLKVDEFRHEDLSLKVDAFRYEIFVADEAPLKFKLETSASGGFLDAEPVLEVSDAANDGCTATAGGGSGADEFALRTYKPPGGNVTFFALCFQQTSSIGGTAAACAEAAAKAANVAETITKRNEVILSLPPLNNSRDDRFQRKLYSVMKVNSLSAEGPLKSAWSTTCRAPHRYMFMWDGMMQTVSMSHVNATLALEYLRTFMSFQNLNKSSEYYGRMCSEIGPPKGCISPTDAMPPNVALTVWDNHLQGGVQKAELAAMFPNLEKYIGYDLKSRRDLNGTYINLLWWQCHAPAAGQTNPFICNAAAPGGASSAARSC